MILVRVPSATPNINPTDDYRANYYAVGCQNGFNKDFGNTLGYEVNGSNFRVLSGELFLFGVQAQVSGSGENFVIDNVSQKRYFTLYCEIDLRNDADNKAELKIVYDSATYPAIEAGDNLVSNRNGIARIVFYRFTATNGIVAEVEKVIKPLIGYGERLDALGFNEAVFEDISPDFQTGIERNVIYKQGNCYQGILKYEFLVSGVYGTGKVKVGRIPNIDLINKKIKFDTSSATAIEVYGQGLAFLREVEYEIDNSGNVFVILFPSYVLTSFNLSIIIE